MADYIDVSISMTETQQYRRLLDFYFTIRAFARSQAIIDSELDDLVEECRQDLLEMHT